MISHFEILLNNIWNYNSCDKRFGQKHPGQIPGQAACYTQEEIAERESVSREAVNDIVTKFGSFGNLAENTKPSADN